jgi:hypothetical protein
MGSFFSSELDPERKSGLSMTGADTFDRHLNSPFN